MKFRHISGAMLLVMVLAAASYSQQSVADLKTQVQRTPHDVTALMNLGIAYHNEGVAGDKDAVEKGFACFDTLLAIDPGNAEALAYRGSLWTLRGRDAWWPFTKKSHVERGLDEMDKAVDLAPDNVSVRLTRGINNVQLPSMFHRLGIAEKDFYYLMNSPAFAHFDAQLRSTIYYWAGFAYKKDDEPAKSRELLQKAIDAAPDSPTAQNARQEMKDLK